MKLKHLLIGIWLFISAYFIFELLIREVNDLLDLFKINAKELIVNYIKYINSIVALAVIISLIKNTFKNGK